MLATVQKVTLRKPHPNADRLDIVEVLGYEVIVSKDSTLQSDDFCVFVRPDSCLPVDAEWAQSYLAYCGANGRVKAIRLRKEWSLGIVLQLDQLKEYHFDLVVDNDLSELLGVTKYEAPESWDHAKNAGTKGNFPSFLPKTDQKNWNECWQKYIDRDVVVSRKRDGSSITLFYLLNEDQIGVCSRNLELKIYNVDETHVEFGSIIDSKWMQGLVAVDAINKLKNYCIANQVNMAVQGELFGQGVQVGNHNPDNKNPLTVEFFHSFAWVNHDYHKLGIPVKRNNLNDTHDIRNTKILPTVPVLFEGILTKYVIDKYDLEKIQFEGVVVECKLSGSSFKIRNKPYDEKK